MYDYREVPLNVALSNKQVPINANIVYLVSAPIDVVVRVNSLEAPAIPFNSVKILRLPDESIQAIYLTTTTTSTSSLYFLVSDNEVFGGFAIGQNLTLQSPFGGSYDSRLQKHEQTAVFDDNAIRDTNEDTQTYDFSTHSKAVITYNNGLDQDVTLKIYGVDLDSDEHQLGSDITVSAGTKGFQTITDSWGTLKFSVQAGVNPSSGNFNLNVSAK